VLSGQATPPASANGSIAKVSAIAVY